MVDEIIEQLNKAQKEQEKAMKIAKNMLEREEPQEKSKTEAERLKEYGKDYLSGLLLRSRGWHSVALKRLKHEKEVVFTSSAFSRVIKELGINIMKTKICQGCAEDFETDNHASKYCSNCIEIFRD